MPLDADNANRYVYAAGDPVNVQDPTGRDGFVDFFTGLGVAAAAVTGVLVAPEVTIPVIVGAGVTGFSGGAVAGYGLGECIDDDC